MLTLLDEADSRATFFALGWIAQRYPELIRRIGAEGHEIASHGFAHRRATEQNPDEFLEDIRLAKTVLEDVCGQEVKGYRAPKLLRGTGQCLGFRLYRSRRLSL